MCSQEGARSDSAARATQHPSSEPTGTSYPLSCPFYQCALLWPNPCSSFPFSGPQYKTALCSYAQFVTSASLPTWHPTVNLPWAGSELPEYFLLCIVQQGFLFLSLGLPHLVAVAAEDNPLSQVIPPDTSTVAWKNSGFCLVASQKVAPLTGTTENQLWLLSRFYRKPKDHSTPLRRCVITAPRNGYSQSESSLQISYHPSLFSTWSSEVRGWSTTGTHISKE